MSVEQWTDGPVCSVSDYPQNRREKRIVSRMQKKCQHKKVATWDTDEGTFRQCFQCCHTTLQIATISEVVEPFPVKKEKEKK